MAKLKSENEPTVELPIELQENLVRLTLKMNPSLAPQMDAKQFIADQTGRYRAITQEDLDGPTQGEAKAGPSLAVRTLGAFFKTERDKLARQTTDLRRQKEALDREAEVARKRTLTLLVNHLATQLKDIDDLKQLLAQNKVFLQELAISERDFIKQTTELRRKLRG